MSKRHRSARTLAPVLLALAACQPSIKVTTSDDGTVVYEGPLRVETSSAVVTGDGKRVVITKTVATADPETRRF